VVAYAQTVGHIARPGPLRRLGGAARVTVVSAPTGSGKTFLLRSWIAEEGVAASAAWVPLGREHRDPQLFWVRVLDALRGTGPGAGVVRELTAAPDLDGWLIVERLLEDLVLLRDRVWLVADDLHELQSSEALRQFELLLMRAPAQLRFVLSMRHDLRLGLHRMRLEGELTEVRADDLRFSLDEARALFDEAGVPLPEPALRSLHERTEGWAAGLKLAALSLAGHPDPERFAAEFSGSERTVAEYLLAEVLERQPQEVRRLLLRTSILDRVNGPLADVLTGDIGGEAVLHRLEQANAFVTAKDPERSWFRYHRLFADLLHLELRRTAPEEVTALHAAAAGWLAGHGHPVESVRHAQAAGDWDFATRVLFDHAPGLQLDGRAATVHELLTGFPASFSASSPELTALLATSSIRRSRPLEETERYLALAQQNSASVAAGRRERLDACLSIMRLWLAQRRGDLAAAVKEADQLLAPGEDADGGQPGLDDDLRTLALFILGTTELMAAQVVAAERHLEQAVALARRISRPSLEVSALGQLAMAGVFRSFTLTARRAMQAIELARRHGWSEDPFVAVAYHALAAAALWQGRLDEAETWLEHAERLLPGEDRPARGLLHATRGTLELARGREQAALASYQAAERLGELVVTPWLLGDWTRVQILMTMLRLQGAAAAEQALARMDSSERDTAKTRTVEAELKLARGDPEAATIMLAPVLDGALSGLHPATQVRAFLLEAIARDTLGDAGSAGRALERALDLAEPDGVLLPFLLHPTPLLDRHAPHRTTHAALIAEIVSRRDGTRPAPAGGDPPRLREPLSESELRVLRYLPTNLTMQEIAGELHVSVNTVKAHARHLYAKLGSHSRGAAVEQARALRLLAPSARPHSTRSVTSARTIRQRER
jgi:LuxR family maltose regulon positive regulatory protein